MTETTDGVQELNEQDLQKVTGGLKWWGNTAEDYSKYKLKREASLERHYNQSLHAEQSRDWKTVRNEMRAGIKSRGNIDWADKKIAQL